MKRIIILIVIVFLICYRARRRPVGGWLLFYYINVYVGALAISYIALADIASIINYYPHYLADIAEIIVASFLINKRFRSISTVNLLKGIFVFSFIFSIIALGIDLVRWGKFDPFDIIEMFCPVIWFLYFTFSKRVNLVFKRNEWDSGYFYPKI